MRRPLAYTPRIAPESWGYSGCPFLCMPRFLQCVYSPPLPSTMVAAGAVSAPGRNRLWLTSGQGARQTGSLRWSALVGREGKVSVSQKRGYRYIRILDFPQTGGSAGGVGGSRECRVPNPRVEYHVSVGNPTIIPTRPAQQGRFVWGVLSGAGHLSGTPAPSYSPRGTLVSWSGQSRMNALTAARLLAARVAGAQRLGAMQRCCVRHLKTLRRRCGATPASPWRARHRASQAWTCLRRQATCPLQGRAFVMYLPGCCCTLRTPRNGRAGAACTHAEQCGPGSRLRRDGIHTGMQTSQTRVAAFG